MDYQHSWNLLVSVFVLIWCSPVVNASSSSSATHCVHIFEEARMPCDPTTQETCEEQGCCWNATSRDETLQCYKKACKPGYFGWGCRFRCNCKDRRPCNRSTGACPDGCPDDSWGTGCILDNRCAYNDHNYENYLGRLTQTERGHTCGSWTKQRAYPGNQFPDQSLEAAENFCRNPKPLDYRTWCYYWEGSKKEWDYCKLRKCDCPSGRFSTNCLKECHCADHSESCDQVTGRCSSGCDERWTGNDCQACSDGYYGNQCEGVCHCRDNQEACNKTTGACLSGCAQGWTDDGCRTECIDGWYGYDCASRCNCDNPRETCNKVTGSCASGCREGYSGQNCQIGCRCLDLLTCADLAANAGCPAGCMVGWAGVRCDLELPVLTRPPSTTQRQATELFVTWPEWRNPPDRGDGPVIEYVLYYRLSGSAQWTRLSASDRFARLTELEEASEYQLKVLAVHPYGESALTSPTLNTSTCGRPEAGPDDLDIRSVESSRGRSSQNHAGELSVAWRLPRSPLLWGCDSISSYKVYYRRSGAEGYEGVLDVTVPSVTLSDLDVYSNYTVSVSLINSAGLESDLSTGLYIGKSGPVEDLTGTSPSDSEVLVTWSLPAHSNGDVLYYVTRYRELRVASCAENPSTWTPKVDVDADRREYHIEGLQPYSQYSVRVWAHTDAGKGQFTMVTVTTLPAVPSAPIREFTQRSVTSETAVFSWLAPDCHTHHGELEGYRYELTDKTHHQVVRQEVINDTTLELRGLVPYTNYSVRVGLVNHAYEGPMSPPLGFMTHAGKPPAPTNLRVTVATSNSVSLTWVAPYPPHGVLDKYELRYWSMKNLESQTNVTVDVGITELYISELQPNTTYGVEIRAYTSIGPGPWTRILQAVTMEDFPGAPSDFVNVTRTSSSITFRWGPPEIQNGRLRTYKILCTPLSPLGKFLAHDLEKEVLAETLAYQVTGLRSGMGYVCNLQAATGRGYGPKLTKVFYTEPKAPSAPFVPEVQNAQSTDTTVTIRIHPSEFPQLDREHAKSVYRIVMERIYTYENLPSRSRRSGDPADPSGSVTMTTPCGMPNSALPDYREALRTGQSCYVTAEITDVRDDRDFVIGDNATYGQYYNAPLEKGERYGIWYGLVLTVDGVSSAAYTRINEPVVVEYVDRSAADNSLVFAGAAIGAMVAVLILICVVVLLLYKKKKIRFKGDERSQVTDTDRIEGSSPVAGGEQVYLPDLCASHLDDDPHGDATETSPLCDAVPRTETQRKPIAVDNLWSYNQEKKADKLNGFRQEYEEIPLGLQFPCELARRPEHKFKNRYGNIIAYDHSRVILETNPDDPDANYINANYIDGYCKPNAFIATQGPSKYTLQDIWRMAWQQNSRRIVMVTNLVEDGRARMNNRRHRSPVPLGTVEHKCEQYWPDAGEPRHYDDIVVELVDTEQFADFIIRIFTMTKDGTTRTMHQLHFTAWPDHGVPTYATSLLAFRRKVRSLDDPTTGPIVVHCSAGVGRTGTYIAVDHLIDQARAESQVDVYHVVKAMRAKRVNMVQTQEQYDFVYEALIEALKSGDTSIPCNSYRRRYKQLLEVNPDTGRVKLDEEYELLSTMQTSTEGAVCRDALTPENETKNRHTDIVPVDNLSRAYLLTIMPDSSDYINAVYVDGYKQRDAFIITQMPLANTVADFWSLIYDQNCHTIIMMNELNTDDPTCACYYPQDVGSETCGPFCIETISIDTSTPEVVVRDLSITYNKRGSNETRFVRQFQYLGWPVGSVVPETRSSVITLLGLVEKWQQRSGNNTIVAHCMDGATRSGLFCAISYMVERLKIEQEVDVFQSVRHTRLNRPQLVPSMDQYKFLYDMAIEYMDCFETYSNFK